MADEPLTSSKPLRPRRADRRGASPDAGAGLSSAGPARPIGPDTQLALREDHAAAVDAVHAEVDLDRDLGHREFVDLGDLRGGHPGDEQGRIPAQARPRPPPR